MRIEIDRGEDRGGELKSDPAPKSLWENSRNSYFPQLEETGEGRKKVLPPGSSPFDLTFPGLLFVELEESHTHKKKLSPVWREEGIPPPPLFLPSFQQLTDCDGARPARD